MFSPQQRRPHGGLQPLTREQRGSAELCLLVTAREGAVDIADSREAPLPAFLHPCGHKGKITREDF